MNIIEVKNLSITALYSNLLSEYDERFKSRQYRIEVTEEYLPDEYLQKIHAPEEIQRIEREINSQNRRLSRRLEKP